MTAEISDPVGTMRQALLQVIGGARSRAKARRLDLDPDLAQTIFNHFRENKGRCALTGLPFHLLEVGSGKARRPFAPSIDRIDSSSGYTRDNVRLVCQAVNFALNAYGEDTFLEIAKAATAFEGREPEPIAERDPEADRKQKRDYINFIVAESPRLLAAQGGRTLKAELRRQLRALYSGVLPLDEANAYGWAFRRLTTQGVLEPSSGSSDYALRRRWRDREQR